MCLIYFCECSTNYFKFHINTVHEHKKLQIKKQSEQSHDDCLECSVWLKLLNVLCHFENSQTQSSWILTQSINICQQSFRMEQI